MKHYIEFDISNVVASQVVRSVLGLLRCLFLVSLHCFFPSLFAHPGNLYVVHPSLIKIHCRGLHSVAWPHRLALTMWLYLTNLHPRSETRCLYMSHHYLHQAIMINFCGPYPASPYYRGAITHNRGLQDTIRSTKIASIGSTLVIDWQGRADAFFLLGPSSSLISLSGHHISHVTSLCLNLYCRLIFTCFPVGMCRYLDASFSFFVPTPCTCIGHFRLSAVLLQIAVTLHLLLYNALYT